MNAQSEKLVQAVKQAVSSGIAKTANSNIPAKAFTEAEKEQPVKRSFLGRLVDGGLSLVKGASKLIPGPMGLLAKGALSTLNDDEWFSEYKSSGATFNEFLALTPSASIPLSAAIARGRCGVLDSVIGDGPDPLGDNFMPSVLAYVRNKTNNVLADDTKSYTRAFAYASKLYAVYYTGMKYVKLSEHQPLNIPLLSRALNVLDPIQYSAFKGVVDTLGHYLKASVRLPYAWTEYLRWRFGTVFYSDNTGKPGLVLYDYEDLAMDDASKWESTIVNLRQQLTSAGRAVADLYTAYVDHGIRYDVEDAHYDEKEFNLRTNVGAPDYPETPDGNTFRILLDSRLDQHAAIQAVTISCDTVYCPISCKDFQLHAYNPNDIPIELNGYPRTDFFIPKGWISAQYVKNSTIRNMTIDISGTNATDGAIAYTVLDDEVIYLSSYVSLRSAGVYNAYVDAWTAAYNPDRSFSENVWGNAQLVGLIAGSFILATLAGDALQLHMTGKTFEIGTQKFTTTMLAYDTALVLRSQIESIQRTAMRNLVRGDYKQKTAEGNLPEVKKAAAEIETAAISDVASRLNDNK